MERVVPTRVSLDEQAAILRQLAVGLVVVVVLGTNRLVPEHGGLPSQSSCSPVRPSGPKSFVSINKKPRHRDTSLLDSEVEGRHASRVLHLRVRPRRQQQSQALHITRLGSL